MVNKFLQTPWALLIWAGLIFFLLTVHTGTMESVPLLGIPHLDKLVHIFLFGVFVWLGCAFLFGKKLLTPLTLTLVITTGIAYGVGMEFYQDLFTTREFEFADIIADFIGAVFGGFYFRAKNKPLWK